MAQLLEVQCEFVEVFRKVRLDTGSNPVTSTMIKTHLVELRSKNRTSLGCRISRVKLKNLHFGGDMAFDSV